MDNSTLCYPSLPACGPLGAAMWLAGGTRKSRVRCVCSVNRSRFVEPPEAHDEGAAQRELGGAMTCRFASRMGHRLRRIGAHARIAAYVRYDVLGGKRHATRCLRGGSPGAARWLARGRSDEPFAWAPSPSWADDRVGASALAKSARITLLVANHAIRGPFIATNLPPGNARRAPGAPMRHRCPCRLGEADLAGRGLLGHWLCHKASLL